jgi:pimeloyl-ACP methyl ester carboxylesterase
MTPDLECAAAVESGGARPVGPRIGAGYLPPVGFASVGDVRLFYTDTGEGGPPLLFVHGWCCDSHDWSWQLGAFATSHRVVAADLRGHGRSSVPDGGFDPRTFAADLVELLERLGTGPVVAVGHSLGGLIVSALAVEHPDHVRAVVAVDPAYGVADDVAELLRDVLDGLRGPAGMEAADAIFASMDVATTSDHLKVWHRRRVLGMPLQVILGTLSGIYEAPDQFGLRPASDEYLARRRCPVLAVHADPARAAWDATTFQHPASRAVSWEGSGHWLHQERPAEFNQLLGTWLEAVAGDGATG